MAPLHSTPKFCYGLKTSSKVLVHSLQLRAIILSFLLSFTEEQTLLGPLLRRAVPRSRLLRVVHMISAVLLPWLTRPNFTTTLAPQHHVVLLFCTCTSSSHFQLSCPFSSCSNIALIWLLGAKYNCQAQISSFWVIRRHF